MPHYTHNLTLSRKPCCGINELKYGSRSFLVEVLESPLPLYQKSSCGRRRNIRAIGAGVNVTTRVKPRSVRGLPRERRRLPQGAQVLC